jgi:succinoglycan biosynthesis protein ExoM
MKISVCIATYHRPDRLAQLLDDLTKQELLPQQVVVVDNDREGSARATVEERRTRDAPYALEYAIQGERNIALTRNRTVELATGEWLAFIDDDERAPAAWLKQLMQCLRDCQADAVLGPVEPQVPSEAPGWIRRGRFYDFPRMRTGEAVPLNRMRFGNAVLVGAKLRSEPGPFDVNYGLTTGEDADLLIRLVNKGAKVVWCDEAIVIEPIERKRLSLRWLLQRALSGGQEFARKSIAGKYGTMTLAGRSKLFLQALAQFVVAGGLAVLTLPTGRHRAASWLIRASANFGKLSIFWGWRYREYA